MSSRLSELHSRSTGGLLGAESSSNLSVLSHVPQNVACQQYHHQPAMSYHSTGQNFHSTQRDSISSDDLCPSNVSVGSGYNNSVAANNMTAAENNGQAMWQSTDGSRCDLESCPGMKHNNKSRFTQTKSGTK